jgi:hypothetical protein
LATAEQEVEGRDVPCLDTADAHERLPQDRKRQQRHSRDVGLGRLVLQAAGEGGDVGDRQAADVGLRRERDRGKQLVLGNGVGAVRLEKAVERAAVLVVVVPEQQRRIERAGRLQICAPQLRDRVVRGHGAVLDLDRGNRELDVTRCRTGGIARPHRRRSGPAPGGRRAGCRGAVVVVATGRERNRAGDGEASGLEERPTRGHRRCSHWSSEQDRSLVHRQRADVARVR